MRTVSRLSITPVKSMALLHPREVRVEPFGVLENRRFYLADETGRMYTGVKHGPLVRIRAEYDAAAERLRLAFPGGAVVEDGVERTGVAVVTDFYGRPVRGRVVEGPWTEALSEHEGTAVRLVRTEEAGAANDVWPVTLVSIASAQELSRRSGEAKEPLDTRRFRILIEMEGCAPHEEDTWIGGRVRVGEAVFGVPGAIPRCAVTTQDPTTGIRDFPTLKAIRAYRGLDAGGDIDFGVYGEVLRPGTVRAGDEVVPLTDGEG